MAKNVIYQLHYLFFKAAFGRKDVVLDFIKAFLGAKILKRLDLKSLELMNSTHVGKNLKELRADMVYRVKFRNKDGYLYLPFEHQSTVDPLIRPRMMRYVAAIDEIDINYQLDKGTARNECEAVDIIASIIYNGLQKLKWPPKPKSPDEMRDFILKYFKEIFLIDLQKMTFEQLLRFGKAALLFILLREKVKDNFEDFLKNSDVLGKLINESPYWRAAIMYLLNGMEGDEKEILRTIKGLNNNKIDNVMEVLEKRERKGIKIGERRGMRFFIKKFLGAGMKKSQIAKKLDMSLHELDEILAEAID